MSRLILASGSPRRRELLASLGLDFEVIPPDVDEGAFDIAHLSPAEQVTFLSRTKAQEVFKHHPDALVIGADTMVILEEEERKTIFGKPATRQEAFTMLKALQGRSHQVASGITVFCPAGTLIQNPDLPPCMSEASLTTVWMRALTDAEIYAYIATGEPMDKAGAYAIQGLGASLIERIEGCYFNVVGMSLVLLQKLVQPYGLSFLEEKSSTLNG